MALKFQKIRIASEYDRDGRLVLVDDALVAILVKLSYVHAELTGHWFLETGYGKLKYKQTTFVNLESAAQWIGGQLGDVSNLDQSSQPAKFSKL